METVGVGQGEIEIVDLAHTTVVVCLPGAGDEVQAIKAGLLEVADVLVLNKADLPGAEQAERHLQAMLQHGAATSWPRPLLRTIAAREEGTQELVRALAAHRAHLEASGRAGSRGTQARAAALPRARARARRVAAGDGARQRTRGASAAGGGRAPRARPLHGGRSLAGAGGGPA